MSRQMPSDTSDAEVATAGIEATANRRQRWARWLTVDAGPLAGLVALFIALSFASPYFLTARNLVTVLLQATEMAMLALGESFVIISAGIDLAVAATLAFSATVGVFMVRSFGLSPYVGIALIVAFGLVIGLVHGLLVTKWRVPALIVTLGGLTLWRGLALQFTQGQAIFGLPTPISWLGEAQIGIVPVAVIFVLVVFTVAHWVLRNTKFGRYLYAIGSDEAATRRFVRNVDAYKIGAYVVSGLFASLGGLILAGRLDSVQGAMASNAELNAIAAVVVGGTSLFGGEGGAWQSLLGVLIIILIQNGLTLLGVSTFLQMVVTGVIIIGVVRVDVWRRAGARDR